MVGAVYFFLGNFWRSGGVQLAADDLGDTRENAGAAVHSVAHFYEQLGGFRQPNVHARAETDQSDALATSDGVAGFFPGNHTAGDIAGNLLEFKLADFALHAENVLFVIEGSAFRPSRHELAGFV